MPELVAVGSERRQHERVNGLHRVAISELQARPLAELLPVLVLHDRAVVAADEPVCLRVQRAPMRELLAFRVEPEARRGSIFRLVARRASERVEADLARVDAGL